MLSKKGALVKMAHNDCAPSYQVGRYMIEQLCGFAELSLRFSSISTQAAGRKGRSRIKKCVYIPKDPFTYLECGMQYDVNLHWSKNALLVLIGE
jgi:hypothetical protein